MPTLAPIFANNDFALKAKLKDIDEVTGIVSPLLTGTVTAFLAMMQYGGGPDAVRDRHHAGRRDMEHSLRFADPFLDAPRQPVRLDAAVLHHRLSRRDSRRSGVLLPGVTRSGRVGVRG
jgi:hypothetical protein